MSHDREGLASDMSMSGNRQPVEPAVPDDIVLGTGGNRSFPSFYASEIRSVIGLAYALSGSRAAAEDLAQEAFSAAFVRWDRVAVYDNPGAFVRRVVANRSVSLFRRQLREAKAMVRLSNSRQHYVSEPDLPSPAAELWAAVRTLPKRQAQVVALHYLDGLSLTEVGSVLGVSKDSANTHLRRARQTLAEQLAYLEEQ
ncbi:MAG TPA: sigma-70 family RNA polymerase sigma factor [Acidimicrobiia bacterium]|nr:sigma-70 family RNA polymerase sigma factor [Acidimicrobiia bacterium]